MKESSSERRLAENEVIFRHANESAVSTLEQTLEAEEKEQGSTSSDKDLVLHFFCECADDKCRIRIQMTVSEYEETHTQTNMFVIVPGHEVAEIEKVTKKEPDYYIVQKYMTPPTHVTKLNSKKKNI